MASSKKDNEISIYRTPDGATTVYVKISSESVWLSLNQIADLFDRDKSVISRHMHILQQLPLMARHTMSNIIIWM